jgi:PilZ domain-containing protein
VAEEKRDVERIPVPGQISGEVTVYQPILILDISERGAQVETPFKLQLDSLHDFRISLAARSVVLKGRVVYCQIGELREGGVLYRSGIEFVDPPQHASNAVATFIEEQRVARAVRPVVDGEVAEDGV